MEARSCLERNGKIVRDHVSVAGRDENHPEGKYFMEWYEGGKRRRQSIGEFEHAVEAARRKSIEIHASSAGIVQRESLLGNGAAQPN